MADTAAEYLARLERIHDDLGWLREQSGFNLSNQLRGSIGELRGTLAVVIDTVRRVQQNAGHRLRCRVCGSERRLGNVANKLINGWPKCCTYTMEWITQGQIERGERPPPRRRLR